MLEVTGVTKDFTPPLSLRKIATFDFRPGKILRALDSVSFSLRGGAVLAVLGPNGAGKTTLLKILSTLTLPDSGTVRLNGLSLGRDDERIRGSIGFMTSSERSFYWRLTGRQNLEFFAALYGLDRGRSEERLDELFALFNIDYQDRRFDSYSTGMQQKMGLIRSLLHDPDLLLLDEPARSLDYSAAANLKDLIKKELVIKRRKSVIMTTHHMDEAMDFADIFMILHNGRVMAFGTLAELRQASGDDSSSLGNIFMHMTEGG